MFGRLGTFGVVTAATVGGGYALYNQPRRTNALVENVPNFLIERSAVHPQMSIARGGTAVSNTRAAIQALGGMSTFIKAGDRVMIKPNLAWKRIPEQAATTNPDVIAELCRLCLDAGAKEVVIFDSPCDPGAATFQSSGIIAAAQSVGCEAIYPDKSDYIKLSFGGAVIDRWAVWKEFPKFDKVINAAIVKHHCQSRATAGMKNWYGILGGDRGLLHQDIHGSIVDLASAIKPTLTVLDAQRVLMRNGPTGGSLGDVKESKAVAAGIDPVALDAWAITELEQEIRKVAFMGLAEARKLGTSDWHSLRLKEVAAG
jgi:uncharacterized protein (DUF362 family)